MSGSGIKSENLSSRELAEELRKRVIRKFEKESTLTFVDNILGAHLSDRQLISKFNEGI